MAIAKKIIEGHQGRIYIKSQPGRGTEVIIELPRKQDEMVRMQKKAV
ncbi:MAG TPA: HAMP domain-containing histidine kinase [Nitrospirae bacterium]|nr:HAMP domain-containing histidine kinase [Nitrospirota bacterium]HDK17633.1 HAMP domain-containing histidine kinase [Nitrospirota bacterium]HDK81122.1 HAMP domain-containing histidine kinase [Nitrospirota bacterium]HDO25217.1 HAMP domain-containing histidine kinase [Nitrospirota bacterium]